MQNGVGREKETLPAWTVQCVWKDVAEQRGEEILNKL